MINNFAIGLKEMMNMLLAESPYVIKPILYYTCPITERTVDHENAHNQQSNPQNLPLQNSDNESYHSATSDICTEESKGNELELGLMMEFGGTSLHEDI